jgi:hypothetical protein
MITVIALKPAGQTFSAERSNVLSLEEQVRLACWGHNINDVGAVATILLMNCIVQVTPDKQKALEHCDRVHEKIREVIERDYEQMKKEINEVKEH